MKTLGKYGGKAIERVINFLNKEEDHSQEELHQFRLALKRLRFISQLLVLLDLDSKHITAIVSEIRPIFKSAGRIREFQLFQQIVGHIMADSHPLTRFLLDEMKNEVAWAEIVFQKNILGTDQKLFQRFGDQLSRIDKHFPHEKMSKRIKKVIRKHMLKWPLSHDQLQAADWHMLRREMKWVLSVYPLLQAQDQFSRPLRDILKHTSELVGEWHDQFVCLEWCRENIPAQQFSDTEVGNWLAPLENNVASRANHFEKAYGVLTEQLEFNEFLTAKG
jgi:CHAD domain-containing protein